MSDPLDAFLDLVAKRLAATGDQVRVKRDQLASLDAKIKAEVSQMGKKTGMSVEGADAKIAELEHLHAHSSMSNAEERQFMRDLETLRKTKKVIKSNNERQSVVDDLKEQRSGVNDELRVLRDAEKDLQLGYRRVKLAKSSGVDASLIIETPIEVPEDRMGAIIGKGGSNLRNFESTYNVYIDTERQGGKLTIMGTQASISMASAAIVELANTVSEELELKDVVLTTLLIDKAALINELQEEHGVKIDVSRAKSVCKVTGHVTQLPEVVACITALDCVARTVKLDLATVPAIMGKGGANVKKIQSEHRVQLDLVKDEIAGTASITVIGLREHVMAAAGEVERLFEDMKEVEDRSICTERSIMMGAVVGRGGSTIKAIQAEIHVSLQVEKQEEAAKDGKDDSKGTRETLVIRGNKEQVAAAKAHIGALIGVYLSQCVIFNVPPSTVPAIVGKKGATLNAIRERFPGVQIDVSGNEGQISIHAVDKASRDQAKAAVEAVVASNFTTEVQFEEDSLIALKGKRGADIRSMFAEHSLIVDMDAATSIVRIKGVEQHVHAAAAACRSFLSNTQSDTIPLTDDGFAVFIGSGGSGAENGSGAVSAKKAMEDRFEVEIYVAGADKDKGGEDGGAPASMKIRGAAPAIAATKRAVAGILAGEAAYGATMIDLHNISMSSLIGKGGSTLKKLQGDLKGGARLDLIKATNQIRIRGAMDVSPAWLTEKKKELLVAIDALRSMVTVTISGKAEAGRAAEALSAIAANFCVDIRQDGPTKFLVRGDAVSINEARDHINEAATGIAERYVVLGLVDRAGASSHFSGFFTRLRAKFGLGADCFSLKQQENNKSVSYIRISNCPVAAVDRVKDILRKEAEQWVGPSAYAVNAVPRKVMPTLHGLSFRQTVASLGLVMELDKVRGLVVFARAIEGSDVTRGAAQVGQALAHWHTTNACVSIQEWMIMAIVGKGGVSINALQEETGVSIKVDRPNLCLDVQAPSAEKLASAVAVLEAKVTKMREEFFEGTISKDKLGALVGKAGANIKALRVATGAGIDVDSKTLSVRVTGTKDKVEAAIAALADFLDSDATTTTDSAAAAAADDDADGGDDILDLDDMPDVKPAGSGMMSHQPLSKSAAKRARQKERALAEVSTLSQSPASAAAVTESLSAELGQYASIAPSAAYSAPAPAPAAAAVAKQTPPPAAPATVAPVVATRGPPVPAAATGAESPHVNVMTKASIARNLVHTGMTGVDIALACQNFPWNGTREQFVAELKAFNCPDALAGDIATAAKIGSGDARHHKKQQQQQVPVHMPATAFNAPVSSTADATAADSKASVDPWALNEASSTTDILDALMGMGGGSGFKLAPGTPVPGVSNRPPVINAPTMAAAAATAVSPKTVSASSTSAASSRQSALAPSAAAAAAKSKADSSVKAVKQQQQQQQQQAVTTPAPVPAPEVKPKSAWTGWASTSM